MLVAVYGTLKTGENNYERFLPGKRPPWSGFVEIPYALYANGVYPMLVPARVKSRVFVEVFEVDESKMRELDALEEPYGYRRESVHLHEWGRSVEVYVHPPPPPDGFATVSSGNWKSETG